ncbi:hypothetical protein PTI98_006709 [Pleurotus ostreatus]|nr:hypothetical protein PTI98_006709 [Pleurotus ostreatus]
MFSQNTRARDRAGASQEEANQPLLSSQDNTIFAVDDDFDEESSALNEPTLKPEHGVRFQEEVQVIAPPLRSTTSSREAEFEADTDELDDSELARIRPVSTRLRDDRRMPLLVGLVETSAVRRSVDASIPLYNGNGNHSQGEPIDIDEVAAQRIAGGNMVDSIANMANSILGAGSCRSTVITDRRLILP